MLKIRKSSERGYFDHGWLKSFHSFSFGQYYDPKHMHFGNLRVINEDFISASKGFGEHPHKDMEIITYVISGALSHKDSMGNASTIFTGEVQIMSAGSGVFHSEFNHETDSETHLLQIWILPKEKNIKPRYDQKSFAKDLKDNELKLVVCGKKEGDALQINQDAKIFLGKFTKGQKLDFDNRDKKRVWVQVIDGEVSSGDFVAKKGDALAIENEEKIHLEFLENSEFLLFEL